MKDPMRWSTNVGRRAVMIWLLLTAGFIGSCAINSTYSETSGTAEYSSRDFDFLAQYGEWLNVDPFGRVWHPDAAPGWAPFSYGHWAMSDRGWMWFSYEPFGWLVYHHGRWLYRDDAGWCWVPGHDWSPANVEWVTYGDNVGWAPLPPDGYSIPEEWQVRDTHVWTVVRLGDFDQEDIWRHRADHENEFDVKGGFHRFPDLKTVELETHHTFEPVKIKTKPVSTGQQSVERVVPPAWESKRIDKYRPEVIKEAFPAKNGNVVKSDSKAKSGKPDEQKPSETKGKPADKDKKDRGNRDHKAS
jgi:hypothetical protein